LFYYARFIHGAVYLVLIYSLDAQKHLDAMFRHRSLDR